MNIPSRFLLVGIVLSSTLATFSEALEENQCPVCFSIVEKIKADMAKDGTKMTVDNISTSFLHLCDMTPKESPENKICYYLGGQDVSATRTYKEMAERMSWGLPTNKVCEHLKSKDPQICEIKVKIPIDLKTVDLKKLKVADLKRILKERGESCDNCFEKSEFIKKVEQIKAREDL